MSRFYSVTIIIEKLSANSSVTSDTSLLYNRNNRGPRTLPCGTQNSLRLCYKIRLS